MLHKIQDLLEEHGELTFQQVCHEMNCFSGSEVEQCRDACYGVDRIGECNITGGTILYPNPVGCRKPRRTEIESY
jgi:hypothetical protein